MKRTLNTSLSLLLLLTVVFGLCACGLLAKDLWDDAIYKEDTEFGSGSKTVTVEVSVPDHTVTFTVKTDKETVGDALLEHGLIDGEEGQYGLYIKKVNGMTADFDTDGSYWAFYIDGEYALNGVDGTPIEEGKVYRLEYTK